MANQGFDLPFYEKIWFKRTFQRVMDTFILVLLLLLLSYRIFSSNNFTFPWFLAFLCESWFTFTWIVILNAKWSPAVTITHPDRLLQRVPELPRVDLFVTTADPVLEPPIITANTLACYVSDDGCSPLTFYALVEASKFAKFWVPFCKKYNVQVRAPFRYFSDVATNKSEESLEFKQEWLQMKDMYENLSRKIEEVTCKTISFQLDGEFAVFSNTDQRNHPSIIKVIIENKDGIFDGLPHLIYASREKRPQYHHNYKAGAMNVLTRVSGLMTNAPFMLNVDCDMFVNNPKIVQHALCILMDSQRGKEVAFVQCFQQFYDGIKDDPFGNQWVIAFEYIIRGMAGLQGPFYGGTNTFHRRNAIYGLYPHEIESGRKGKLEEKILIRQFGSSKEFIKSAAHALGGNAYSANDITPSNFIEAATQVANCEYEDDTFWGKQMGWLYGSISEDVPTGLNIQRRGWRSECCTPDPIAFTGCAPGGLLTTMVQQKRWASGLTVVFFGKHSPLMGMLFGKIQFRAGLSYFWLTNWGLRAFFLVCYVALLEYCIITNTNIFPKGLGLWIPIALFVIYNAHTLLEYLTIGLSMRHWWNNQRMCIIRTTTAWFVGFLSAVLKLSGISDTVFEITEKEQSTSGADGNNADAGRFTFDESPVFVVGTTILLVHLTAMLIKFWGLQPNHSGNGSGLGEFICSTYLVVCYWPYFKGLFARGKYGIPLSTICKSAVFALVFVHFCGSKGERNFNRFGGCLGKNSTMGKNLRLLDDLHVHILASRESSSGRDTIRMEYLTLLKEMTEPLPTLPKAEAVQQVVELMNTYSISQEDFDTIVKLSKFRSLKICSMANQGHVLPLSEKIWFKRTFQRVIDTLILVLLLLNLSYRVFSSNNFTFPWFLAFICESWFTFIWIVILNTKWSPAVTITHPNRLLQRVPELPPVDMFVTTADPVLEPPIITINTVLSLLALDYPANKLACYVSDDGCSPLTFYALVEASKFAKFWVPFCKKYNVQVRAPFRYFSNVAISKSEESLEFKQEWLQMKDMYHNLSQNLEEVTSKTIPFQLDGEYAVFSNTEQRNHPTIIKVIFENMDGLSDQLPHLIYISREKRPQYPHNYKAGAMNVLTRVSGLMTNAPFMLNVDCDMFVNNPKIVQHAMCILMDSKSGKEVAFVQCFQQFYDGIKDDPFGNQWVAVFEYIVRGMAGLQGPFYCGTNTFHRRKAIYGVYPDETGSRRNGKLEEKILIQQFGSLEEFVKSAAHAMEGSAYSANDITPSSFIEAAIQVADCGYEDGTWWGKQMGWLYGSLTEDVLTGLSMKRRGWRSECCTPDPIAFTGCAPGGLLSTMLQQKRWFTGHTVIFFGKHSPLMCMLFGKIQFRAGLSYFWVSTLSLRGVFLVCYIALLAYCMITNTNIFPKGLGLWIPITLFVIYNVYTLLEYVKIGLSMRQWWNNQRMCIVRTTTASFLGFLNGMVQLSGLSDIAFDITEKEYPTSSADENSTDAGRFTFNESPVFVIGTTILLVYLTAILIKFWGLQPTHSGNGSGLGEFICSTYVVVCFWPYLKGLFARGNYGIPLSIMCKSAVFAFVFVHFCRSNGLS
ncbi:Cellulose synthase-like protein H1 [Glycine max]|nr:Cellulose synthase-like protein H1 [Glycine max]